jgi:hypothetical protein
MDEPRRDETETGGATYKVVRFFRVSGRRRVIMRGVSLEIARLHCSDPRTCRSGVWFDGYMKEGRA